MTLLTRPTLRVPAARQRLMDLGWASSGISLDLLILTHGPVPGAVAWGATGDQVHEGREALNSILGTRQLKQKKSRSLQDLILRRDDELLGVATLGEQVLLVGKALPVMGVKTKTAVGRATAAGLELWTLSFFEAINGVMFCRRGRQPGRHVSILKDQFRVDGDPLAFELPVWDGHTRGDRGEEDGARPCLEERLAKAALSGFLVEDGGLNRFLQTPLTVFQARRP